MTPKIRFFEGEDGMKQLMKDLMWHDGAMVETTWNDTEIKKIFDSAFLRWWNERRVTRKIKITWLCPKGTKKTDVPDFYNSALDTIVPVAHSKAPLMTRLVYANKVACISSQKEAFGFIVESKEFATLERN